MSRVDRIKYALQPVPRDESEISIDMVTRHAASENSKNMLYADAVDSNYYT
jgi:hypothetical protein